MVGASVGVDVGGSVELGGGVSVTEVGISVGVGEAVGGGVGDGGGAGLADGPGEGAGVRQIGPMIARMREAVPDGTFESNAGMRERMIASIDPTSTPACIAASWADRSSWAWATSVPRGVSVDRS